MNKEEVVVLVDIDKTVIGPRTMAMPGESGKTCDWYIDEARREAVTAYASAELFPNGGQEQQ